MGERGFGGGQLVVHIVDGSHDTVVVFLTVLRVQRAVGVIGTVVVGIPLQPAFAYLPGIV